MDDEATTSTRTRPARSVRQYVEYWIVCTVLGGAFFAVGSPRQVSLLLVLGAAGLLLGVVAFLVAVLRAASVLDDLAARAAAEAPGE